MSKASILKIPFEFKSDELVSLIDSLLPDTLLEKDNDLPLSLKIIKGNISKINLTGKNIDLVLSMNIELEKKIGSYILASGNGEIELDIFSQVDIDENWNLKTSTTLVEYNWIRKPLIKLIGLNISAPELVEQYIDYKQSEWMNQIDSTIAKSDLLRKPIDSISYFFSSPIKIDSSESVGLKITPNSISLSPFISIDNSIKGMIGFMFNNDLITLNDFEVKDTVYPIFNWSYNELFEQKGVLTFTINENLTQKIINDYFKTQDSTNRIFEVKGSKIKIEDIDVIFDKEIIGAKIDFSGDKEGNIIIKTHPVWDEKKKHISLLDNDVDINLNNFGSQILLDIFKNKIKKKIVNRLEEEVNKKILEIVGDTNVLLKKMKYGNNLEITKYNIPMQLEGDYFMIDIDFFISGDILLNKLRIKI